VRICTGKPIYQSAPFFRIRSTPHARFKNIMRDGVASNFNENLSNYTTFDSHLKLGHSLIIIKNTTNLGSHCTDTIQVLRCIPKAKANNYRLHHNLPFLPLHYFPPPIFLLNVSPVFRIVLCTSHASFSFSFIYYDLSIVGNSFTAFLKNNIFVYTLCASAPRFLTTAICTFVSLWL
jgi:hypothetical protein